jgi:hypothetical protein
VGSRGKCVWGSCVGVGLAGFVFVLVVALPASTFPPEVFEVGVAAVAVPDNMVCVGSSGERSESVGPEQDQFVGFQCGDVATVVVTRFAEYEHGEFL